MTVSPLQLRYSLIDRLSVEAVVEYDESESDEEAEPEVEITAAHSPDHLGDWVVWVEIRVSAGGEATPPYAIDLEIFGRFEVTQELAEDERALVVNGASMLYSAAREFLLLVTSRGPYQQYVLPTLDFRSYPYSLLEPSDEEGQEGEGSDQP